MRSSAISTPIIVGAVVVVVVVAGGTFFLLGGLGSGTAPTSATTTPAATTSVTTTTSTGPTGTTSTAPSLDLQAATQAHLAAMTTRNIPTILQDYSNDAVVEWAGNSQGLQGNNSGQGNIRLLLSAAFGTAQSINLQATGLTPSGTKATYNVVMNGTSQQLGDFSATASAIVVYSNVNGHWLISQEVWTFHQFTATNAGGITTFPQWRTVGGPIDETTSPDPFKQFIWNFGGEGMTLLVFVSIAVITAMFAIQKLKANKA